jgi:hypothetical protein
MIERTAAGLAAASYGRRIKPGWKTSSTRLAWSSTASPCVTPSISSLARLRADGHTVLDADVTRLSPYIYAHVNVHGHYTFQLQDLSGRRRPLHEPGHEDDP